MTDAPKEIESVFHYTDFDKAANFILKNMSLRLSALSGVNDPREISYRDFYIYARTASGAAGTSLGTFDEICRDIVNNTYVMCCGLDRLDESGGSTGALRPRMWASYGGGNKGVCLVLDRDALGSAVDEAVGECTVFSGNVNYRAPDALVHETMPSHSLYYEQWLHNKSGFLDFHIDRYWKGLFFYKHEDWRDENECRWVVRSRKGSPFFADIRGSLKCVVLGSDIEVEHQKLIVSLCAELNVPVKKVVWRNVGYLTEDLRGGDGFGLTLNGGFSTTVPCISVFIRGGDKVGDPALIGVGANTGNVVICEGNGLSGGGVVERLKSLGVEKDSNYDPAVGGFSAARLSEERPLEIRLENGEIKLSESEEKPFYGLTVIVNNEKASHHEGA